MRSSIIAPLCALSLALSAAACGDSDDSSTDTGGGDVTQDTTGDTGGGDTGGMDVAGDSGGMDVTGDTGGGDTVTPPMGCDTPIPAAPAGALCAVSGSGDALLIRADLVLPDGILERGSLLVEDGVITCVGCDCASRPAAASALTYECAEGLLSPGLINAHDHMGFTQGAPIDHGTTRYDHRHEWRRSGAISTPQNPDGLGDAWGEIRQTMAGTTSLFGSGTSQGFLRNLDRTSGLERLQHDDATYDTFPLGDSDGTLAASGCGAYDLPDPSMLSSAIAYVPHVSEGVIAEARNEFVCISGLVDTSVTLVADNVGIIHGIGMTAADIALAAGEGVSLVWSPRSNTDLYGFTADVPIYDVLGANIALGTDWTYSGSVTILRELACAADWSALWNDYFTDQQLIEMVTFRAAEALGFGDITGSLTVGRVADLTLWDATTNTGYRAILDAQVDDVALVLRGGPPLSLNGQTHFKRGTPLYGDADLVQPLADRPLDYARYDANRYHPTDAGKERLPDACEIIDVCGRSKRLCLAEQLEDRDSTPYTTMKLAEFRSDLGPNSYDLFFCGDPVGEPTCTPSRPNEFTGVPSAGDADGDNIADAQDNCPNHFNAPRPMDGMSQPDADGDSLGDICDPCPFDANTTACTSIDPDDIDGDGFANLTDNCPSIANDPQTDTDNDMIGDACDACPMFSNVGGLPCPASIYDVKNGTISVGERVLLRDLIVTAVGPDEFFAQLAVNSDDYAATDGADFSAIYTFNPGSMQPLVGDTIDLSGTVNDFFGQTQLQDVSWTTSALVGSPVTPLTVTAVEVAPGGAKAAEYEGLLVTILNPTVTSLMPTGQTGETVMNEFVIDNVLSVDDQLFLIDPYPVAQQVFSSLTGVLRFNWERNKLMPRSAADIGFGPPSLDRIEPATSSIWNTDSGVSSPPATVWLSGPAIEAITVTVSSGDTNTLTVDNGGVTFAVGEIKKAIALTAVAPGGPVTLTASYDGDMATAEVTVLDLAVSPKPTALTAASTMVTAGTTVTLTLDIDLPAKPDGTEATITTTGDVTTAPATITVPAGATSTTFDVELGATVAPVTVTADIGGETAEITLTLVEANLVGLIMVEVFYNPTGGDDGKEWVKLYNGSGGAIDLNGYALGWGGSTYTSGTQTLSGTVANGECFVVGGPTSDASSFNPVLDQSVNFTPDIQNSGSGAGDGIALFDTTTITASTVPIDAVVYGANNDNGLLGPDGNAFPSALVVTSGSDNSIVRTGETTWALNMTPNSEACIVIQ